MRGQRGFALPARAGAHPPRRLRGGACASLAVAIAAASPAERRSASLSVSRAASTSRRAPLTASMARRLPRRPASHGRGEALGLARAASRAPRAPRRASASISPRRLRSARRRAAAEGASAAVVNPSQRQTSPSRDTSTWPGRSAARSARLRVLSTTPIWREAPPQRRGRLHEIRQRRDARRAAPRRRPARSSAQCVGAAGVGRRVEILAQAPRRAPSRNPSRRSPGRGSAAIACRAGSSELAQGARLGLEPLRLAFGRRRADARPRSSASRASHEPRARRSDLHLGRPRRSRSAARHLGARALRDRRARLARRRAVSSSPRTAFELGFEPRRAGRLLAATARSAARRGARRPRPTAFCASAKAASLAASSASAVCEALAQRRLDRLVAGLRLARASLPRQRGARDWPRASPSKASARSISAQVSASRRSSSARRSFTRRSSPSSASRAMKRRCKTAAAFGLGFAQRGKGCSGVRLRGRRLAPASAPLRRARRSPA